MKAFLLLSALVGTAVAYHYWTLALLAHGAVVIDPSPSVERNCTGVRAATETMLQDKPGIREGSMLHGMVMGVTQFQTAPTILFSRPIPIAPDLVISRDRKQFQKEQEALFAQVESDCEAAPTGSTSPIYELVKHAISHLRGDGTACRPEGRCYLLVKSDLDEGIQPEIRAALARSVKYPQTEISPGLAASISNAGIEVRICGISEVKPRRAALSSPEARERIWKALFTNPQLVSIQRYCGA